MIPDTLNPLTQILAMGTIAGIVIGYALRKLNKVIAAVLGFFMFAMNASYLSMMMGYNLNLPAFDQISETIIALSPITPEQIAEQMGPYMPLFTSVPFIGGLLLGVWIGFKIAG